MQHYIDSVTAFNGNKISNAKISVTDTSGTAVPIYLDIAGTTPVTYVNTDINGEFNFYVPSGRYNINVSGVGITPYSLLDVFIFYPNNDVIPVTSGGTGLTTLTAGYIPYGNGTGAFSSSAGLFYDGTNLGIGTSSPATKLDVAGTAKFGGSTSQIAAILTNAAETTNITAAALTGVLPVYLALGAVQYYTAVATGSWTPNISLSSLPTTLNTALAIGQSTTVAFMATQGTTAYFSNALQIDGVAVTPKWQGGAAPTAGNVSGIDVYTYTIVKTAASTYTVLASMTQFK